MNDPRPQNPYGKLYTVEFLGNMVGARCTMYNNQPIQLLKNVAAESIKKGEVGGSREQGPRCPSAPLKRFPLSLSGRVVRL